MNKLDHKKLPAAKYCFSYSEAKWLCRVYGISKRCIQFVPHTNTGEIK